MTAYVTGTLVCYTECQARVTEVLGSILGCSMRPRSTKPFTPPGLMNYCDQRTVLMTQQVTIENCAQERE